MAPRVEDLDAARYDTASGCAYLSGIQVLVRLLLDRRRLDAAAGLNTAGFVSGYRGSPLGGLDRELWRQATRLSAHDVVFQPGINEDLAATAVWGSQQVGLFPGARCEGVFGMWYGKAPGLDRSSDALRHANAAGTSPAGGALLVVGDDPACKSSTLPNASEYALRDLAIPVLVPADVQEVLDFGLFGWALSRFAGCFAALVVVTDVADSACLVQLGLHRHQHPQPTRSVAPHIRLGDSPVAQEARLALKVELVEALAAAGSVNRVVVDVPKPQLAVVTAGRVYHDVREALARLGLGTEVALRTAGVRLVKLGMTWPLGLALAEQACRDAGRVLVVENKRPFIEQQLKCLLPGAAAIIGGKEGRHAMLPVAGELDVPTVARALAAALPQGPPDRRYLEAVTQTETEVASAADMKTARKPMYCAGCPHNTSTRVPAGSRAGAGIGCHYMAQWMDRDTATVTHMGAEGVNWIGQAPFTSERHVFVNLGDGTFSHSGILAIRAAVAAGVNITYKVLANDAVAMTGGQPVEGGLTVAAIVAQVQAEGVAAVRVVSAQPRRCRASLPRTVPVLPRHRLDAVQRELRDHPGCTVLVYDQTCAAELRRRRKHGQARDPDVRVAINDAVCEGCGDCSRQSNCVAVAPLATALGTKRTIDQSACNKDLACLAGLCPALVTLRGAKPKRLDATALGEKLAPRLPLPRPAPGEANILIAGVGGTGIVTLAQLLGTAAKMDGKPIYVLDMTGLAQKGGAVLSHVRIGACPATRIPAQAADLLLAADPLAGASREALAALDPHRTMAVHATHVAPTAEFVLGQPQADAAAATQRLRRRVRTLRTVDARALAVRLFGTTAAANVLLLGYAWQLGAVPVSLAALQRAIRLNGVAVADNLAAFHCGRAAAWDMDLLPKATADNVAMQPPTGDTFADRFAARRAHLVAYQDEALASRYERMVRRVQAAERTVDADSTALAEAVAEGYFRLLAVKDEYEVARLFTMPASMPATGGEMAFAARLGREFAPGFRMTFHFGRDVLPWRRGDSRRKFSVGAWALPLLRLLALGRRWRGHWLDPLRLRPENRCAQALRTLFEADYAWLAGNLNAGNLAAATELARLPATIKGFGAVRHRAAQDALAARQRLWTQLLDQPKARPLKTPAVRIIAPDAPAPRDAVAS